MVNMDTANGSLKPAEEIALEVLQQFHQWKPNPAFILVAGSPAIAPQADDDNRVTYDCIFTQLTGLAKPVKAAAPTLVNALGFVTITTAVGDSAYYSLDGSYPSTLYSVPVAVVAGQTVRSFARRSSAQDSDLSQIIIP
jgi:hypothetical protein